MIPHGVLPPRVLAQGVLYSAVPLVWVCAAGAWGVCGAGAPRAAPWPLFCLTTRMLSFFARFEPNIAGSQILSIFE